MRGVRGQDGLDPKDLRKGAGSAAGSKHRQFLVEASLELLAHLLLCLGVSLSDKHGN